MSVRAHSRSPWKRLAGNKLSIVGLGILSILVVVALLAPWIAPYDPQQQYWAYAYTAPCRQFLLGTDSLGRDLLSRILYGARTSLFVGVWAVSVSFFVGVGLGSIAGYFGKGISQAIMRLADVFLSIPSLILMIVVASVLAQRNLLILATIIGIVQWPSMARVTRSKFLALREEDYVEASRALGSGHTRIIFRHILPNSVGPIVVLASLNLGGAIIAESSLSFLGLGDPRAISWGNIISMGLNSVITAPWISIFPGIVIFIAVWAFNVVGDALRDALDVKG